MWSGSNTGPNTLCLEDMKSFMNFVSCNQYFILQFTPPNYAFSDPGIIVLHYAEWCSCFLILVKWEICPTFYAYLSMLYFLIGVRQHCHWTWRRCCTFDCPGPLRGWSKYFTVLKILWTSNSSILYSLVINDILISRSHLSFHGKHNSICYTFY